VRDPTRNLVRGEMACVDRPTVVRPECTARRERHVVEREILVEEARSIEATAERVSGEIGRPDSRHAGIAVPQDSADNGETARAAPVDDGWLEETQDVAARVELCSVVPRLRVATQPE